MWIEKTTEVIEVLKKYLKLIATEYFAKYEKDFVRKVQIGLIKAYQQEFHEPGMVSVIEEIINNLNELSISINGVKISTKSIFIHGNKSQVEFEYYGKRIQRELGDLIFILSVIYKRRKYFEKFTISQFKKGNNSLRWDFRKKEQVYLLSRFPSFRGIKGIIPKREFNLPNYSGCLGSFNLLFRPGDFLFVSAPLLEISTENKKSIEIVDLCKFWEPPSYYFTYPIPFDWPYIEIDWPYIEKLFYLWRKLWKYGIPIPFFPPYFIGILGFSRSASNIHEFVDKYLRGNVGELTYSVMRIHNPPAFNFLHALLSVIMAKGQKEKRTEIINFVNEFFKYPYSGNEGGIIENIDFDHEGGGIGIIYTSIDLSEGKE